MALTMSLAPTVQAAAVDLKVKNFSMSFLMDAPVEKIKGSSSFANGVISVDASSLQDVKGTINVDLSQIKLHTFADETKNTSQTEHMYNWFEIGGQVDKKLREKFLQAELKIDGAVVNALPASDGKTADYNVKAETSFALHGITKKIPVELNVTKTTTGYKVKSAKPMLISLADFDVKPRDVAGKLMQMTLESLGQKVAKEAQVTLEMTLE
jgi:hypothetical protein